MTRSDLNESAGKAAIGAGCLRGRRWMAGVCLGLAMANPVLAFNVLAYRPPPRPMTNLALVESHRMALAARTNEIRVSAGRSSNEYRIQQLGHPDVYAGGIQAAMRAIDGRKAATGNEAIKLLPDFASAQEAEQFKARSALANPTWHGQYFALIPRSRIDWAVAQPIYSTPAKSIRPAGKIRMSDGQWFQKFHVATEHGARHVLRVTSTMRDLVKDLVKYLPWAYDHLKRQAVAGSSDVQPSSESVVNLALAELATKSGLSTAALKELVHVQLDDRSIARNDEPASTTYAFAGEDHGAL